MFQQAFDNLKKATDASVQMQQEMFKKWVSLWPGLATPPTNGADQAQHVQKKWSEATGEMFRRQREFLESQFKQGLQHLEKAFQLGKAKTPEEMQALTLELWQKCFEGLQQAYEAQLRECQTALGKWTEFMTKGTL